MKVLVTGGAGYIGSHTCKALARAGHEPVVFDNLSTGHGDAVRWGPLHVGDILDPDALDAAFARHRPDVVIHFAALAYVGASVVEPSEYYRVNVTGTQTLLDAMRRHGVTRIVLSSSCATYGIPALLPISEATPQNPVNPYGFTKLATERLAADFERAYGMRWVALRYFNAAGADPEGELGERHDPETHAIPLAIRAALGTGPAFSVLGTDYPTPDGSAVRDYVHVSDLADAHLRAMDYLGKGGESGAFNLATGQGTSVLALIDAVAAATGRKVLVVHAPRRAGDPPSLYANADLAAEVLGWHPRFTDIGPMVGTAARWFLDAPGEMDDSLSSKFSSTDRGTEMTVRIAIVGTGYVGLVTGACLADLGHDVICVDNNAQKIEALNNGRIPIYEPGLDALVRHNVEEGRLRFSMDLPASVSGREAVFIAVGTPSHPGTDRADLRYVNAVAEQIASGIDGFTVVVTKSTVPVGTNRQVQAIVERCLPPGQTAAVASNPEFLREGSAIEDFMHPDRIVFGTENAKAAEVMRRIYAPLEARGHEVLSTEIETAEVIKYAANAFLAVKISYINEMADLCEAVGADVERVATGIGLDHRIGAAFLKAGPGWGGSCFPKDTRALKAIASQHVVPMRIVDAAIEANSRRKDVVLQKIEAACGGSIAGKRLAVFGLTFKGQTDDVRESPSIDLIRALAEGGARIHAYDPSQPAEATHLLPDICMTTTPLGAIKGADALVIMTEWKSFVDCDLGELAAYMSDPVMIDLRNLFDEGNVRGSGFRHYARVGRKPTSAHRPPLVARAPRFSPRPLRKAIEPATQPVAPVATAPDLAIGG